MSTESTSPQESKSVEPRGSAPLPTAGSLGESKTAWAPFALRATALITCVASVLGPLLSVALRGVASERVLNVVEKLAGTFTYVAALGTLTLAVRGAFELGRQSKLSVGLRLALGGVVVVTCASLSLAFQTKLPEPVLLTVALLSSLACIIGGSLAMRAVHTRASSLLLFVAAACGSLRSISWFLGDRAAKSADVSGYRIALVAGALGLFAEVILQLLAALWLVSRGGKSGRTGAYAAVIVSVVFVTLASRAPERSAFSIAANQVLTLIPVGTIPESLVRASQFLGISSIALACAFALQNRQIPEVVASVSILLLSRGMFDIPMFALLALVASVWIVHAAASQERMWTQLLGLAKAAAKDDPGAASRKATDERKKRAQR